MLDISGIITLSNIALHCCCAVAYFRLSPKCLRTLYRNSGTVVHAAVAVHHLSVMNYGITLLKEQGLNALFLLILKGKVINMTDFIEIVKSALSLAIFRNILENQAIAKLLKLLNNISDKKHDQKALISEYSEFVSELYKYGDSLTEYLLKIVLEDENIYMLKKGAGEEISVLLEECLAHELLTLQILALISSDDVINAIGYSGFLPKWKTENIDFSRIYAERIREINKFGYGIYAKNHIFIIKDGKIKPVSFPDNTRLSQLSGYEMQRQTVIDNTVALLNGKPANNVLLYGDCGTGKSSTVKAIANEYKNRGLRLIELKKKQLHEIPLIVETVSRNPLKFILFIDDLSFTENDDDFAALKAILEGSVSSAADNLVIYATSNRRHLIKESFSTREGDDIHFNDTMQELLSLSDRFGIRVVFEKPDKKLYLNVVGDLARLYKLDMPIDEIKNKAEVFALERGGRSPRVAKQFIEMLKGIEE